MSFAHPLWLLLGFLIPLLIWRHRRTASRQHVPLQLSQAMPERAGRNWRTQARAILPYLRWITLALLVIAMARPQRRWQEEKIQADALDIVLSLDISLSMLSKDFEPDRLSVAKQLAINFVQNRPYDRIGLVAFSAEAFTQCPPTSDRKVVQAYLRNLKVGLLEHGTAIGMGLATAVNRLKDSPAASRVVVLLTDGENNAGYISPLKAASLAQAMGVRVYTIGLGSDGIVMTPEGQNPDGTYFYAPRRMVFDTKLLEEIAAMTEGRFYRARTPDDLRAVYDEIDQLEKTQMEIITYDKTEELFYWPAGIAIALLLLELLLRWLVLRSITL
jgi:Ca-activated chloride channel family protein